MNDLIKLRWELSSKEEDMWIAHVELEPVFEYLLGEKFCLGLYGDNLILELKITSGSTLDLALYHLSTTNAKLTGLMVQVPNEGRTGQVVDIPGVVKPTITEITDRINRQDTAVTGVLTYLAREVDSLTKAKDAMDMVSQLIN